MNKVILVGRLARDPELRTTTTGKSVCNISVAVDRRFKQDGQPTADFFNVTAWGRQGEVIDQYLGKGNQIALSGRLQSRSYDGQDGVKRYVTEVILEELTFVGGNKEKSVNENGQGNQGGKRQETQQQVEAFDDDFYLLPDDDDLPF